MFTSLTSSDGQDTPSWPLSLWERHQGGTEGQGCAALSSHDFASSFLTGEPVFQQEKCPRLHDQTPSDGRMERKPDRSTGFSSQDRQGERKPACLFPCVRLCSPADGRSCRISLWRACGVWRYMDLVHGRASPSLGVLRWSRFRLLPGSPLEQEPAETLQRLRPAHRRSPSPSGREECKKTE